jgi:signal transduction histidine kinase
MFSFAELLHELMREVEYIDLLVNKKVVTEKEISIIQSSTKKIKYYYSNVIVADQISEGKYVRQNLDFDLAEMISDCVKLVYSVLDIQPERFKLNLGECRNLNSDPLLVKILLVNLIENSLKHGLNDIEINLTTQKDSLQLEIVNEILSSDTPDFSTQKGHVIIEKIVSFLGIELNIVVDTRWKTRLNFAWRKSRKDI